MGSTRLPGKVLLPLDREYNLQHVINRAERCTMLDSVVVATSDRSRDDILQKLGEELDWTVFRGSEEDLLERYYRAARQYGGDVIVRITADCPLLSWRFVDAAVEELISENRNYVAASMTRTFPRGITAEVFDVESFDTVRDRVQKPYQREHVTPYYRENPDQFDLRNILSDEVFDRDDLINRTDLRLTLDEAEDYLLLRKIYNAAEYDKLLPLEEAITLVDDKGWDVLNQSVQQKSVRS